MDPETLTRERAYLLWQQAGCPDGRSEEFWFAAAQSVAAEAAVPAPTAKKAAALRRAGAAVSSRTAAPAPDAAVDARLTSIKRKPARVDKVPS